MIAEWLQSVHNRNPDLANIKKDLKEAVFLNVTDVARFYYESAQEVWNLNRDFPNVAPPWETMFLEWTVPNQINTEGIVRPNELAGWSMACFLITEDITTSRPQMIERATSESGRDHALRSYLLDLIYKTGDEAEIRAAERQLTVEWELYRTTIWDALPPQLRRVFTQDGDKLLDMVQSLGARWTCQAVLFAQPPGSKEPYLMAQYQFPVNDEGGLLPLTKDAVRDEDTPVLLGASYYGDKNFDNVGLHTNLYMHIPLLAISFCHCKNVLLIEGTNGSRAERRRQSTHLPNIKFKRLDITPMKRILRSAETGHAASRTATALHICRGHFMDYRNGRGLFGKHHGLFWQPMHVKGTATAGTVHKSYKVAV